MTFDPMEGMPVTWAGLLTFMAFFCLTLGTSMAIEYRHQIIAAWKRRRHRAHKLRIVRRLGFSVADQHRAVWGDERGDE